MSSGSPVSAEQSALSYVLGCLRNQRGAFLITWGVICLLSLLYAFLARPIYRAELVLAPAQSEDGGAVGSAFGGQLGQLASFAGINMGQNDDLQTNLAVLESNSFTLAFIDENDLLPVLYEDRWDPTSNSWVEGEELTDWEVLDDFNKEVRSVLVDPASGLVRLRIDWYSPELAAEWANAMGRQINERARQRVVTESNESIEYLQNELGKTNLVGIEQAINGLIESQINKIMLANVRKDYAFQVIDPAMAPSLNLQLRPNRALVVALGLVLGFILGAFVSIVAEQRVHG